MNGNNRGRKNWTFSLTIAVVVAVAAAVIGCVSASTGSADRVYLKASAGSVLFDHGKHGQTVEACASCHHELFSARQATSCAECHDEDIKAADFEHKELQQIHARDCSRCHEVAADATPKTSCRECHEKTQSNDLRTESCQKCHDDDSFKPGMMAHDEYLEIESHSCSGCHNAAPVAETYHTNCSGCHLAVAPEKFADSKGAAQCQACHLR